MKVSFDFNKILDTGIFEFADYKTDDNFSKNKMADPKWQFTYVEYSYIHIFYRACNWRGATLMFTKFYVFKFILPL